MREIAASEIENAVAALCISANRQLPPDLLAAMKQAAQTEPWGPARNILSLLLKNAAAAEQTGLPLCQDTGIAVVYVELGQELHVRGSLMSAIQRGVAKGYQEGYLRKSMVADPIRRVNTGDNTPPVVHMQLVPGDRLNLTVAPKGCGSENMSRLRMLMPSVGLEGVKSFVMETVKAAGANPCPPMVIGVGIGSDFEGVAALAKKALLLPLDKANPDPFYQQLETEWLREINQTGIGPQGLGGLTTCLGLHILAAPTHIASLPVAVNIGCHVTRHASAEL